MIQPLLPLDAATVPMIGDDSGPGDRGGSAFEGETSLDLLERAKAGERAALEALMARYLPRLRRWASGRLPRWARDLSDTEDLVQETLLQTFKRIDGFEIRHEGALQAYLRQAVVNRIRDELRRVARAPATMSLTVEPAGSEASPLEVAIGREALDRYERALARLRPDDRAAIVARIEMDCSNEELRVVLNKPSANAARMAAERALIRLADEMRREL
jgi:RNA polymerase sigma factor (sigma-70 family)